MDLTEKCKAKYIDSRPFDRQRARALSGIAAVPHEKPVDTTKRLFAKWAADGLPDGVPILFGLVVPPPAAKKYPTPTAPGYYWAKHLNPESEKLDGSRDWEPVEVFPEDELAVAGSPFRVFVLCHERSCELDEFFWGPKVEGPT